MKKEKVKQQQLPGEEKRSLRWGSHVPVSISILKAFPITGVLELGAGMNSTPVFFNNVSHVISIEADLNWIQKLLAEEIVAETDTHKLIHHYIPEHINRSTKREYISRDILSEATIFYKRYMNNNLNYLFVDCFAGFRLQALLDLHEYFDVITYHDAEPKDDQWYGYSKFQPSKKYYHFVDQTFLANTGILISKNLSGYIPKFKTHLEVESIKYADKFNTICNTTLIEKSK